MNDTLLSKKYWYNRTQNKEQGTCCTYFDPKYYLLVTLTGTLVKIGANGPDVTPSGPFAPILTNTPVNLTHLFEIKY